MGQKSRRKWYRRSVELRSLEKRLEGLPVKSEEGEVLQPPLAGHHLAPAAMRAQRLAAMFDKHPQHRGLYKSPEFMLLP